MSNDPAYMMLLEQARYARTEAQLVAAFQNVDSLFLQAIRILGVAGAESENSVRTIRSRLESAARSANVDDFNAFVETIEANIRDAVDIADAANIAKFKLIAEALWARYQIQITNGVLEFHVIGNPTNEGGQKLIGRDTELSWAGVNYKLSQAPVEPVRDGAVAPVAKVPTWAIGAIAAAAAYFLLS